MGYFPFFLAEPGFFFAALVVFLAADFFAVDFFAAVFFFAAAFLAAGFFAAAFFADVGFALAPRGRRGGRSSDTVLA